jgi:hypothetical protein
MSKTTTTIDEHVEPSKAGCCGGEHGKDKKVPLAQKGQAVPSNDDKHEPAQQAHSSSCGCGSGNAKK